MHSINIYALAYLITPCWNAQLHLNRLCTLLANETVHYPRWMLMVVAKMLGDIGLWWTCTLDHVMSKDHHVQHAWYCWFYSSIWAVKLFKLSLRQRNFWLYITNPVPVSWLHVNSLLVLIIWFILSDKWT